MLCAVVLGACRDQNPNLVADAVLAQELLIDQREIEAYLEDFPLAGCGKTPCTALNRVVHA